MRLFSLRPGLCGLGCFKKILAWCSTELNYAAMVCSLVARLIERIPTVKDLVKRLKHDFIFRLECGFLVSDQIPSEASYSRLVEKFFESNVFVMEKESILLQAIDGGFVDDKNIAIDASHFEARDKNSEGKNVFWYGYKAHLAVGTKSQYIPIHHEWQSE